MAPSRRNPGLPASVPEARHLLSDGGPQPSLPAPASLGLPFTEPAPRPIQHAVPAREGGLTVDVIRVRRRLTTSLALGCAAAATAVAPIQATSAASAVES